MADKAVSDAWWRNTVWYALDVKTYSDSDGDGWGDFTGLTRRMSYLRELGIGCLWLTPFHPSPMRDDGYDVADYYGVDPRLGTAGDLVEMVRTAHDHGIRVVMDLVVNHTSDEHPWFREARSDARSPRRGYYVWSREQPPPSDRPEPIFPGEQKETWTFDEEAGEWYFHRYHDFQPDLAFGTPQVHDEIHKVIGFWLELGLDGFRVDSLPFLIDKPGRGDDGRRRHRDLRTVRDFLSRRRGDAVLLGEANLPPDEQRAFFGDPNCPHDESEVQLLFDFAVQGAVWLGLAQGSAAPLERAIRARPDVPDSCSYAVFARTHDELTLEQVLTADEVEQVRAVFAPDGVGWIYGRGLRRRLASLLRHDDDRIRLVHSLVHAIPGVPVLQYGDEVGLADDLELPGRLATRVPMRWTEEDDGGFSDASPHRWARRAGNVREGASVAAQRHVAGSLLEATRQLVHVRRECAEIGFGATEVLPTAEDSVLGLRSTWLGQRVVTFHNVSERRVPDASAGVDLDSETVVDLLSPGGEAKASPSRIPLEPWGYRWLRLDASDATDVAGVGV
ncbi:alpha-amylase family glycosyl hydrolase [Knoellia koreensis]|uniref:Trehalose synthase n=1 Tax=Knoellia koreensis TaxID=2730921 RepID=A0A849H5P9_9MICO|nr:alpha-amylase family glycosyl hydrolase [Knoellia sp. DB2414S]NNM45106.1 trehalose synthase [Knoellia sp. DB2414S]